MILEHLVIQNFRPYHGRQELHFAEPGERNVTVVRGLNGTGKSSVFMALKWCFSGDAPVETKRLVNTSALKEATPGDRIETRVEVSYGHEGRRFKAIRVLRTHVGECDEEGNPTFAVEPTSDFTLFELLPSGDAKPVEAPYDEVRSAVPHEALDYFFFDAEKIEKFAADSGGGSIREAIREVLRFAELENAMRHVDAARQEYARRLKSVSAANTADLIQGREDANARATFLLEEVERLEGEIAAGHHVHDEHVARLRDLAAVRDLAEERGQLVAQRDRLSDQRNEAIATMAAGLPGLALVFAAPALLAAKDLVDSKRRRGEIPSKVKAQVLRDWLDAGRCICGRPLGEGSTEREAIEHEIAKSLPSRVEDELVYMGGSIDASRRSGLAQVETSRLSLARLNQARDLSMAVADRLNEIDQKLRDQPVEDVAQLALKIDRLAHEIEDLGVRRSEASRELAGRQADIDRMTGEIARAEQHNREARRINRRHDLAARTVDALRDLKKSFEDDVRREVESEASELFLDLIWKSGYYAKVTLSPDFRLEAIDKWGEPAFSTGTTSMGEARVLSIAFIVAMQVVARESLDTKSPAVIDSPFGNLSIEPMNRICDRLPELVDQVVLFLTDADWANCAGALRECTGVLYEVAFDEAQSAADLKEMTA